VKTFGLKSKFLKTAVTNAHKTEASNETGPFSCSVMTLDLSRVNVNNTDEILK